jgi:beta-glucanase (GH16 family)
MPLHRPTTLAIVTLLLLCGAAPAPQSPAPAPAGEWKLVWSDEFDRPGSPDPAKWDYEEGFIRNNESQYYTRGRSENARVEGGHLVIEARHEPWANPRFDAKARSGRRGSPATRPSAEYTSASLTTFGRAEWTYGRVEVRAKLPKGRGVWPAAWMLGVNRRQVGWPACGEIDILEFVGHTPDTVHATVHFRNRDGRHQQSGDRLKVGDPCDDFHVYAVEWTPEQMEFFFDGRPYHHFDLAGADDKKGDNAFLHPQHLILNFAVGGAWGGPVDPAVFPQQYLVDYVRVYQRPEPAAGAKQQPAP